MVSELAFPAQSVAVAIVAIAALASFDAVAFVAY